MQEIVLAYANGKVPYYVVAGTVALGLVIYAVMRAVKARRGIRVEYAFAEIPPE